MWLTSNNKSVTRSHYNTETRVCISGCYLRYTDSYLRMFSRQVGSCIMAFNLPNLAFCLTSCCCPLLSFIFGLPHVIALIHGESISLSVGSWPWVVLRGGLSRCQVCSWVCCSSVIYCWGGGGTFLLSTRGYSVLCFTVRALCCISSFQHKYPGPYGFHFVSCMLPCLLISIIAIPSFPSLNAPPSEVSSSLSHSLTSSLQPSRL